MKHRIAMCGVIVATGITGGANAQEVLAGDTKLACEAILCLSTGSSPSECSPSLARYFSIEKRKLSDTIRARKNFLEMCPASNQTQDMQNLVSAISRGAGRCDAASLNQTSVVRRGSADDGTSYISDRLPDYCVTYTGHAYTDFNSGGQLPKYVGTPERGGYWVEAAEYERARAEYDARVRAEDEASRRSSMAGN